MWYQFLLENLHFALNLIGALAFFTVFWLYFDAWLGRKAYKELFRWLGFLLLSISFILTALQIESTIIVDPILPREIHQFILSMTKISGYIFTIVSLLMDPLMAKPKISKNLSFAPIGLYPVILLGFIYPILAAASGFLYLRRATIGLENHLKPVGLSFFIIAISELLSLGYLLQNTNNRDIYNFVAPFGILWCIQHLVLLIAVLVLRRWIFGYLLKRFQSQLFIIYTSSIVVIFLLTTVVFSAVLLRNQESIALNHLRTDVSILKYSIESKKSETLSDAQMVASSPDITKAIIEEDKKTLKSLASSMLLTKKHSSLLILSPQGVVLSRGEDPERIGDSISDDALVKKARQGVSASSVITKDGVVAPTLLVRSAVPINNNDQQIGIVVVGIDIDNAFVDGVKLATKLDVSVYADNIRSATTYFNPDGKSRSIGILEKSEIVQREVLQYGKEYTGSISILNTPYLGAFAPVLDDDNVPVGMLFVGMSQIDLLRSAGKAIELTFVITVVLLILSIIPAYLVARYINSQLK